MFNSFGNLVEVHMSGDYFVLGVDVSKRQQSMLARRLSLKMKKVKGSRVRSMRFLFILR